MYELMEEVMYPYYSSVPEEELFFSRKVSHPE